MARWEPGTRDRLRAAAIELFTRHGYAATTVDDIADHAGVTQRTFFRHFIDKEEVLFDEDDAMQRVLVTAATEQLLDRRGFRRVAAGSAPSALAAARHAMHELAATFEDDHTRHRQRAAVLAQVPALQGRQHVKQERWSGALREAMTAAGVAPMDAAIAVEIAASGLRIAYAGWVGATAEKGLTTVLIEVNDAIDAALEGYPVLVGRHR